METPKAHFDYLTGAQELSTNDNVGSALGSNATKNGQVWDCGRFAGPLAGTITSEDNNGPLMPANAGHAAPAYFRAFAASDQEGSLYIQQSPDGKNWFITDGSANNVAAGFTKGTYIESKIVLRYVRAQLANGSTAQTDVEFDTAIVSI